MAKIILAVSGGIDSMTMLDMICRSNNYSSGDINFCQNSRVHSSAKSPKNAEIIVAHFDHGIRENSAQDADFVREKAADYGLRYIEGNGKLGANASEEIARKARYEFLTELSLTEGGAEIFTAHHLDDLTETIAINLLRGTGWRGLAPLNTPGVRRPFLELDLLAEMGYDYGLPLTKKDIFCYAAEQNLTFREDQTNSSDEYLRNRLRHQMNNFGQKVALFELWESQKILQKKVEQIVDSLLPKPGTAWVRQWFQGLDRLVALELLRAGIMRAGVRATRPQLEAFRQAILNYSPGKYFNLPGDHLVRLEKVFFQLDF